MSQPTCGTRQMLKRLSAGRLNHIPSTTNSRSNVSTRTVYTETYRTDLFEMSRDVFLLYIRPRTRSVIELTLAARTRYLSTLSLKSCSLPTSHAARLICQSLHSPLGAPDWARSSGMFGSSRKRSHQLELTGKGARHSWYAFLSQKLSLSQLCGELRSRSNDGPRLNRPVFGALPSRTNEPFL